MARDEASREAEKKIEEARRLGAEELDLSAEWGSDSLKLTELPEALVQLTQLQTLDLSRNQLTTLPEWLCQLTHLQTLYLSDNQLTTLPEALGQLTQLQMLTLSRNQLTTLPEALGQLTQLQSLRLGANPLVALPETIRECVNLRYLVLMTITSISSLAHVISQLTDLRDLNIWHCKCEAIPVPFLRLSNLTGLYAGNNGLTSLPTEICQLEELRELNLSENQLTDLPASLAQLEHLEKLVLSENPLNPELAAAYEEGLDAVKRYLRLKTEAQVILNEAKLILIGEGEVGKSCLLGALRGDEWFEGRPTTHGIDIKPVEVADPDTGTKITLNGWDFGGQRVYRPTHQLFFSAPAVYLVVWKPREGPQQGFVKEWVMLVKLRAPDATILVAATHGGPGQRQPDIDRQELWDLFGRHTVLDFFHVDSKPDAKTGERRGVVELRDAIVRVAAGLPEMGRTVPDRWQQAREALQQTDAAYLSLERVQDICREYKMDEEEARLFVSISHRLGHLIHYEHDPRIAGHRRPQA